MREALHRRRVELLLGAAPLCPAPGRAAGKVAAGSVAAEILAHGFLPAKEQSAAAPPRHLLHLGDTLRIAALSMSQPGDMGGQRPWCHSVLAEQCCSWFCSCIDPWCLPRTKRDQILMFAEGFETQCTVQSMNCFSHRSKAPLGRVVPGRLVLLTLAGYGAEHVVCRGQAELERTGVSSPAWTQTWALCVPGEGGPNVGWD